MAGVTAVAAVGAFVVMNSVARSRMQQDLAERAAEKLATIDSYRTMIEERCLSHAALFSATPEVQRAYALAHEGNIDDENDPKVAEARTMLREVCGPIAARFCAVTGQSGYRLHFHLPNGRSLLRVWRSNQSTSDDISDFRQSVLDINGPTGGKPLKGIEIGRGGFAIRGLAPVTGADGTQLGSVEMLSDFNPVVLNARHGNDEELAVFMDAAQLGIARKLTDESTYPRVDNEYVLVASTDQQHFMQVVSRALLDAAGEGSAADDRGELHVVASPIRDYRGHTVGRVAYAVNCSAALSALSAMRMHIAGGATTLLMLLVGTAMFVGRSVSKPIERMIVQLDDGADQVNNAAGQVATSSQVLATGTSQQAAALEETGGALEEMSEQTRSNAQNARQANEIASRAKDNAGEGERTMADLNRAVQAINDSSGEISKIIRVIEEIAFQTNLLALNAAVEAARAGEHGKGFAVVAEEVRSLAQRSAQAARDTTSLIEESVTRAREGSDTASAAAAALQAIVGDVSSVATLLDSISQASEDQAHGVAQVNTAVTEMNRVTQANAAGSEQSAAAAEELSAQSHTMKSVVDQLGQLVGCK
jgi:methyl-accepting chemotaxis protein